MRSVSIVGIGQIPAGYWADRSLIDLAAASLRAALRDAGAERVQALFVCAMPSGQNQHDENLAALVASVAGLAGNAAPGEARLVASTCGGGAALHMGVQAVATGAYDVVAVTGVGMPDGSRLVDAADEAAQGLSVAGLNALIMRRYMYEFSWRHDDFAGFAINARRNAATNSNAMLNQPLSLEQYRQARVVADPLTELDAALACAGSATVILCPSDLASRFAHRAVRVVASDVARDTAALHDRADVLWLAGAYGSARAAYAQASLSPQDIDLLELHDASTIMAALSLEAAGFAGRGDGVRLAHNGAIALRGKIPISTMGGLLARGDAGGASGVYQAVEVALHLRGEAGANQVDDARVGMAQSLGGSGACAATHILAV